MKTKEITVQGKLIKLNEMPKSKKGATKYHTRAHVPGVGTLYVVVYEDPRVQAPKPAPRATTSLPTLQAVQERETMIVEILKKISERVDALEDRATAPAPRPSRPGIPPPGASPNGHTV